MNTNVNTKRILLYGDSLVYGKKPGINERWNSSIRFSGILQSRLGDRFDVIEEGLRGRTLKGENPLFKERNGLEQFGPIVGSQLALDLIVVALGSNDCNLGCSIEQDVIKHALDQYKSKLSDWCTFLATPIPKLLIVTPPKIIAEYYDQPMKEVFGQEAPAKQAKLEDIMINYCHQNAIEYLISSAVCSPSKSGDGIHLDDTNNQKLGQALYKRIIEILN